VIQDEHEGAAKKGLAVLTEMWRRHVWRAARTVNVIAAAALHKSSRIMLGALKFFLGQDLAEAEKQAGGDGACCYCGLFWVVLRPAAGGGQAGLLWRQQPGPLCLLACCLV
jgi:hypothetical protein